MGERRALPNPLLPNESCNLGSLNVAKFAKRKESGWEVDWQRLEMVVRLAVRFLDNVIEANAYPIQAVEEMTKANRKIGLGVMGFADLLIRLGYAYNSEAGVEFGRKLMGFIQSKGYEESLELAKVRGTYPNYPGSVHQERGLPLRNATVTTIAPTGTISIIAGCSSGIEPLFALAFTRNVMDNDCLIEVNHLFAETLNERHIYDEALMEEIAHTGSVHTLAEFPADLAKLFVTAHDISPQWHIQMQAAFQEFTDNAVSKTVNFPQSATKAQIEEVYKLAYQLGCKGVTVYRSGSREGEVLTVGQTQPANDQTNSVTSGDHSAPRKRPSITQGQTERVKTGCGTLYVTINEDEHGICEVFTTIGKAGGCASAFSEATARLISLALRSGVELAQVTRQLKSIRCPHPMWQEGKLILSCPDAIAQVFERYLKERETGRADEQSAISNDSLRETCPECSGQIVYENGCSTCKDCGYSRCG